MDLGQPGKGISLSVSHIGCLGALLEPPKVARDTQNAAREVVTLSALQSDNQNAPKSSSRNAENMPKAQKNT